MIWGSGAFQGRRSASRGASSWGALRTALLATASLAMFGAGAGPRGNGRRRAHQGLSEQSRHQYAARRGARGGRKRSQGERRLSADRHRPGQCRHRARATLGSSVQTIHFRQRHVHVFIRAATASRVNETMFNGNKTISSIRQAESEVFGAREQLRNTEQNTLLAGVTAYMDVLRDTAILDLDRNNVQVLQEQLRETRDRFTVGEVTRTDVAQAEASLASAQATALSAEATLEASIARYRQVIGDEPKSLAPVKPIVKPLPKTLPEAIAISQVEHPAITASLHGVDAAQLQIKIAEGALYPTVGVSGSITNQFDASGFPGLHVLSGQVMGQITIPIYQGGAEYASTRQAKEHLRSRSCRPIWNGTRSGRRSSPPGARTRPRSAWCARRARRSPPTKSRSPACAKRPRSANARLWTCSTRSRRCSTPASSLFRRNTTRSSIPIRFSLRSAVSTFRPSDSPSPNTIRACISTRSRTSGSG